MGICIIIAIIKTKITKLDDMFTKIAFKLF